MATLRAARGDGRGLRAGARRAEGERHRVTSCDHTSGCITCGDEAVEMTVGANRRGRGLALCEAERERGRRSRSSSCARSRRATGCSCTREPPSCGSERRMRFVDEFRDAELGRAVAGEILSLVEPGRHYKVMEVCGGHTHSIYKYGIDDLLPENVELVHGPGCPVCVIPMGRVDDGIALAHTEGVIFTCFGDMMRVPGSNGSLLDAKAEGADIRMVYSPLDALRIAKQNPDRAGRLLRDRLRDDRALDRADAQARQGRGRRELLLHVQPRDDRAAAARAARLARPAPRRLHRAGARLHGGRRAAVRVHPGRLRQADRGLGLRAARRAPVDPDDPRAARRGPLRGREPVQARGALRGQPARRSR